MCVRYTFHEPDRAIAAMAAALACRLDPQPEARRPRYNVTLTDVMPVAVAGTSGPELREMRWGLVSSHERNQPKPRLLPNARAETASLLPAFKTGVARRRCLVPANGFYEWQTLARVKVPHLFTLQNGEPFAFAGIWNPPEGESPPTFCILTTAPNELVARIHTRMPVILPLLGNAPQRWLGDQPLAAEEYVALTQPLPSAGMQERPLSAFVGHSRNEGPECHAPPAPAEPEFDLG